MGRILVVEDDPVIQKALMRLFVGEGFAVEIQSDGEGALDSCRAAAPSAIVLDLRVPKLSRKDLCQEIKTEVLSVPIIILRAALNKPFSPRELLARVRVALRRPNRRETINPISFDGIVVDFNKMEVTRDSKPVILTAGEFKTLQSLIQNADLVITRGALGKPDIRTIDNHILKLRQKLERVPHCPIHILTVHSIGYKFVR
jgi:DNA-binding response OmpR family regulator